LPRIAVLGTPSPTQELSPVASHPSSRTSWDSTSCPGARE
jgi:hypothetical protein